jgi:hypothetical protein
LLEPGSTVRQNPRVVHRRLAEGEGGVLLHLETSAYPDVNEIGLAIWEIVGDGKTIAEVVQELGARVSDPPAKLEDDVIQFLDGLRDRGLVTD